jgi:hypothetical protein
MSADMHLLEQIIPASLERLVEMSRLKQQSITSTAESKDRLKRCQACSTEKNVDELSRCKGCEAVWYCDKVSEYRTGCDLNENTDETFRAVRPWAGMRKGISLIVRF